MDAPGEELQKIEASLLAKDVATRAKALKQAKARIHWSDLTSLLLSTVFFFLSYLEWKSINRSETGALYPAINFVLGFSFLNQTFIAASSRRLDALVQLFESLQKSEV